MPSEIAQRAERIGRYILWVRHGLLVIIILSLAVHESLRFSDIGLRLDHWRQNSLIGIAAAFLPLGLQGHFWRRSSRLDERAKRLAGEPTANWIASQFVSVLAEELWMAFCLVSFIRTGHSALGALILTATIFGALHFQHGAGAVGSAVYGAVSGWLFLWQGSLVAPYLFHYVRNMGALYAARRASRS